jgi:hypothetical protein
MFWVGGAAITKVLISFNVCVLDTGIVFPEIMAVK